MAQQKKEGREAWLKSYIRKQRLALHVSTIRRSRGMTVSELAEASGYEPSMIRKIENGNILPAKGKDRALADALDISLDQLWGRRRKWEFWDDGNPKLNESEKTALFLYAPIIKALTAEGRSQLIDHALTLLRAQGTVPEWEKKPGSED